MAVAYINKTIELPTVTAQRISREMVGERSSTALGKLRQDVVRVRRVWRLECKFLTNAQYTAIISSLESAVWAAVPFWLDEFGGTAAANSITAYVDIEEDERVQFRAANNQWESKGRHLTLIVRER